MTSLYQVWALNGPAAPGGEPTEELESLQPDEPAARQYAGQLAKGRPNTLRVRIRSATMTDEQIRQTWANWGEADARAGRPAHTNGKYLADYLTGYRKGRPPARKSR